jgi:hypothetical protein
MNARSRSDGQSAAFDVLGINSAASRRWRVFSLIVVANELLTPFLLDPPIRVVSLHDLQARESVGVC